MVDGVYDRDPNRFTDAVKYEEISFQEILEKQLGVMDSTPAALCKENHIPVLVFSLSDSDHIVEAIEGKILEQLLRRHNQ
jgi:uridylate kinase